MRVGSYDLLTEIGRGAMGAVHVAHAPDGSEVALKVFSRKDAAAFMRFEHDRPLLGTLGEAEGFVPILDAGGSTSGPFTVMPLVQGDNLRARLARGPMGVQETLELARALATALGHAHIRGIVHSGVKPENVLFTNKGTPLLADVGLAKHFDSGVLGNWLVYRAPEQTEGGFPGGPRADVFSLGAVLQECLAGPAAFAAAGAAGQRPELLGPWAMEAPWSLLAAIERALARDPRGRFADGFAMLEALEEEASAPLTPPSGTVPAAVEPAAPLVVRVNEVVDPVARPVVLVRPPRIDVRVPRFGRRAVFAAGFLLVTVGGFGGVVGFNRLAVERRVQALGELERRGEFANLEAAARTLALDAPGEPRAQRFLARAYAGQDRFREALEASRRTAELSGGDPEDMVACGIACLAVDDANGARRQFEMLAGQPGLSPVLDARASAGLACAQAVLDPESARSKAMGALSRAPDDGITLALGGKALLRTGDAAAALEVLGRAEAACPHDDGVRVDKACALAATGESEGALALVDEVLTRRAEAISALRARARIKLRYGDSPGALEDAAKARSLDPSCQEELVVEALAATWLGRLDDAEQRLRDLAQVAPSSLGEAIARSELALARGKPEESFVALRDAPAPADGLLVAALRSIALQASLRLDEARREADFLAGRGTKPGALWLAPGDDGLLAAAFARRYGFGGPESTGHALAAEAFFHAGRNDDARRELEAARRAHPVAIRSAYVEGMLALATVPPDTQGALRTAEIAIQQAPEHAELRELRARVRLETKALALALSDVEMAVKLDPKNYRYHLLRGRIRLEMGDTPGALRDLDQSDRLAPRIQPEICVLRARLLVRMSRPQDALKAAMKGLVYAPGDVDLLSLRGKASCLLGGEDWENYIEKAIAASEGTAHSDSVVSGLLLFVEQGRFALAERLATEKLERLSPQTSSEEAKDLAQQLESFCLMSLMLEPERPGEALARTGALLAMSPGNPSVLAARAFITAASGRDDFLDDVKKSAHLALPALRDVVGAGLAAAQNRDFPPAFLAYFVALATESRDGQTKAACWRVVARAHEVRGHSQEAAEALEKAAAVPPDEPTPSGLIRIQSPADGDH